MKGFCHICRRVEDIKYCPTCTHWLCDRCRNDIAGRTWSAVKHLFSNASSTCCGTLVGANG